MAGQLAKHGLENSHDRAPSFHQLQSSSAAKIKGMVELQYMTTPVNIIQREEGRQAFWANKIILAKRYKHARKLK